MRVDPRNIVRRLNPTCTHALEIAVNNAASQRFYEIGVEHLLFALLDVDDSDADYILRNFRTDRLKAASEVERSLQSMRTGNQGRPVFAENLFNWLEDTWVQASLERQSVQIRSGDLMLAFITHPARYTAENFDLLEKIDEVELKKNFASIIANSKEELEVPAPQVSGDGTGRARGPAVAGREALDRFTISYTEKARSGEIDPIFGRDREIRKLIDILARRRKNNPIVIGEAGVGKTALVEGLALAIANGDVPGELKQVELVSLDMGLLKAGAGVKGELENRLKKVIAEVKGSPTPIIVFIDEAHTLVGGGASDNDIPNMLKPALARGEFRTIAATTFSEFKKYFEKDPAFERRFQPVQVDEPSVEDAAIMLRGLRNTYETAHQVIIRDDAIVAAAELSDRYISGRQLPDKAVDLLDTASARVKIEQDAPPHGMVVLRSRMASLQRELDARKRDVDDAAEPDDGELGRIQGRMDETQAELAALEEKLAKEQEGVRAVLAAQEALRESSEAGRAEAVKKVEAARAALAEVQGESGLVHHEVDREAIAQVVADWTGIPVGKMKSSSIEVMLKLEDKLEERIKGQDHATAAVAEAIRMSHAGVRAPQTPIAVMLFVGPSGVGKTETALALADLLYGGERQMVTINMSEFQEKHTVSRLIGSPPGYVGYGEGGVLTEAVRQKPYSVVLLDECEKADLEVMNLFYQVFDKGMLSDGEGRVINFRNTVVILTSNLATDVIMNMHAGGAKPDAETVLEAIRPTLSKHFKPALLARMSIVPYRPMDPEILGQIARLKLSSLAHRLEAAHGVTTTFEDSLVDHLVARCTEGETGARALDHAMRGALMPNLAKSILEQMAGGGVAPNLSIGVAEEGGWEFSFKE